MSHVMKWVVLVLLALVPAFAEEKPVSASAGGGEGRNPLVSVQFENRPLAEVLDYLARQGGVNLVAAQELANRKVTVFLFALDWKKALRVVADQVGGYVEEVGPNFYRITNPPRVTYTTLTDGNDIKEVLTVIAEYAGANIVVADTVKGKVNLRLKDVPWKHAVMQAVKAAGDYAVVEEEFNLLRVVPSESLKTQTETRIFTLKYLNAPSNYKATLKTNYALARDYTPTGKPKDMKPSIEDFTLYKALKNVLTPNLGKLDYDPVSNILLATDVKPRLDEMQRIIEMLDVEPIQILVDVKFVTTTNTDLFDFGVDWGAANNAGSTVSIAGGSMLHTLPFNLGHGGFEDNITVSNEPNFSAGNQETSGPNASDVFNATGPTSTVRQGNSFTFGTLDFTTVQAVLRFFKRDAESKVVQQPKIFTLDNQEATLFVGDTIRYAETVATSSSNGSLVFSLREVETPVRTGFQLYVVPHVVPGTDRIMMTLIPESNTLSGTGTGITGFDRYTNGTQTIDLPRITSRTLVTKMMLEDGQTAIVGGLLQENETNAVNKFPILGDIPILGWFFKSDRKNKAHENLIIFITPRVIRNPQDTQGQLLEELKARDRMLREMLEAGEKPAEEAPDPGAK